MTGRSRSKPGEVFDPGVQHERTALAWERTAIAIMVNGVLLARYAAQDTHWTIAFMGLAETVAGGGLLVWAGLHYEDLHGPLRSGQSVVHPTSTRIVGTLATFFMGVSMLLVILETVAR